MPQLSGHLRVDGARLAWSRVDGAGPVVIWLGGFGSDMNGTKASALAEWAERSGRAFIRFDYFGHGDSDGHLEEGTITRWRGDVLAVIDSLSAGPVVLVGSSLGGWLACLAGLARSERVTGLVLVAPATDFTGALIAPSLTTQASATLKREGVWRPHGGPPISRLLLEDGARWSILPGPVPIRVPIRILQGGADTEVPWRHGLELALALESEDVIFTMVREGDHRLSRPADLVRLIAAVEMLG